MPIKYKNLAWSRLRTTYWMVFVSTLVVALITGTHFLLIGFLLSGPIYTGLSYYLLNIIDQKNDTGDRLEDLIIGFKDQFVTSLVAHILKTVFVLLWSLLFIIPGIIKALAYSQTFYLLSENKKMTASEALKKSEELMRGHKTELFFLYLSFIGWLLLSVLTFGIGLFFLLPYIEMSLAYFYRDLKPKKTRFYDDADYRYDFE